MFVLLYVYSNVGEEKEEEEERKRKEKKILLAF